jgi:ribosome biogenesis GTPase / thiamine phosphate phosphatase
LLDELGWDARVAALYDDLVGDDAHRYVPGRVVRVERSACVVVTDGGEHLARASVLPAVGDWVALEVHHDDAAVLGWTVRWSELARRDPNLARPQVLAANVDLVFMTVPGDRPSVARVERETVLAWDSGARPVVVLTKSDLAPPDLAARLEARLVGVDLVVTSTVTGEGVGEIAGLLAPHRTAVLLGPSGAGKSTLVNALLGEERLATGDVRAGDARGRHTTTTRELVVLPGGGVLIDTPGLRSLGLLGDEAVSAAFGDVEELAASCRFRDCAHDGEPGCAVQAAVDDGTLDPARLESFRKLEREAAFERRRDDPVARQAEQQRWKQVHKDLRRAPPRPDERRDRGGGPSRGAR